MSSIHLPTLYPKVLRAGDPVALVSPAGPVDAGKVEAAVRILQSWGLEPRVYPHALGRHSFYAASDEDRLADLNDALADPQIRAVLCNRGGYGLQRIVQGVDIDAVRRDPKLITGFSDVTALHGALWRHAGLATVHGPVATQLGQGTLFAEGMRQALMTTEPSVLTANADVATVEVRTRGRVEGVLLGGNLSILSSSVGTPFMPDLDGAILLLEEVGEAAYRVDRMITHLLNCGILQRVAGIAVGDFSVPAGSAGAITPAHVLDERLAGLGIPVLGGLPVGHGTLNQAVAFGTRATLDADEGVLRVAAAGQD
ncbi:LD-carboxypeptidase [Pseudomonas sp. JDS28PS106]|uniref:S66 peptidase family protein n=1 Tax=Pseudomonas sp. JDS28PS106 TaxID=2497235 RepID=UPI002FD2F699